MEQSRVEEKKKLHSRYNPSIEAEKYIDSLPLRQGIRFFILIEPGMGYMIPVLEKKFPGVTIVALHVEDVYPEGNVQSLLEKVIPDMEASAIEIIEWRPSLSLYKERYVHLMAETVTFIKRIDANKRTTAYFGKKWFGNFFKNIAIIDTFLVPEKYSGSCVIAGAGPSLEEVLPIIKKLKETNNVFVLAASSAVEPFLHADLRPDMVIATDGGNWALFHLFSTLRLHKQHRKKQENKNTLAISTVAALPSQAASFPVLLMTDGSRWQKIVLAELGLPFLNMIQRGTVTASALDLAFMLFQGNVFIAGMDLANDDIRAHARPYPLDFYMEHADRLTCAYSAAFAHTADAMGSMSIYAEWFKKQLPSYPKRLYTIGSNNSVFSGLPSYEWAPWTNSNTGRENTMVHRSVRHKAKNTTSQKVETILTAVIRDSSIIKQELLDLLSVQTEEELTEEICCVLKKYKKNYQLP
ncbi:MAG: DUF115 domain-containing protein [Treponema sp.]|jgi:hypothetical protein|nr:DUF115 domain-containing protein [Treponema sp.]